MQNPTTRSNKAFNHFRLRLSERYDLAITKDEWLELATQITNGHKYRYVGRSSETKTWWIVVLRERFILGLYCSKTSGFLSCLPIDVLDNALKGKARQMRYLGMTPDSIMIKKSAKISDFLGLSG